MNKNKDNKKKVVLNIAILLIIVAIVLYFLLKDNFNEIMKEISKLNPLFLILGIILVLAYRFFSGLALHTLTKTNTKENKLPPMNAFKLSLATMFFNGITPFATGGQPMQLYYFKKEGVSLTQSSNIILQNSILYQIALIMMGTFAIICNKTLGIFPNNDILKNLVIIGFVVNSLVCLFLFLITFGQKFSRFILNKGLVILAKMHIIKNIEDKKESLNNYITKFYESGKILIKDKKAIIKTIIFNLLSLTCLYLVPLIVIYGMGDFTSINIVEALVASSYVMIMGAFVPTPGGTGGLEYGFINFYGYFITGSNLMATMIIWRGITYYIGMILGGIVVAFYKGRDKKWE